MLACRGRRGRLPRKPDPGPEGGSLLGRRREDEWPRSSTVTLCWCSDRSSTSNEGPPASATPSRPPPRADGADGPGHRRRRGCRGPDRASAWRSRVPDPAKRRRAPWSSACTRRRRRRRDLPRRLPAARRLRRGATAHGEQATRRARVRWSPGLIAGESLTGGSPGSAGTARPSIAGTLGPPEMVWVDGPGVWRRAAAACGCWCGFHGTRSSARHAVSRRQRDAVAVGVALVGAVAHAADLDGRRRADRGLGRHAPDLRAAAPARPRSGHPGHAGQSR